MEFNKIFYKLRNYLERELTFLWFFSLLLGFALIILQNKNKLPLGKGDFVFLLLVTLLVALYRPRWIFFLFVGSVALENIILAGGFLPVQIRPYQFLGGILAVAVAILYVSKKLKFEILKPSWIDWLVFSLIPFSFLALFYAPNKIVSLKNNLILASFVLLYFLTRNFLRSRSDLVKTTFFFFGSFAAVAAFGFYQVFTDRFGVKSFEVMFGRPNSTFAEPDWLGTYLVFTLAFFLALIFYFARSRQKVFLSKKYILIILDILVFLDLTLIILTLSRSAWLGAAAVIIFYLLALIPTYRPTAAWKNVAGWKGFSREAMITFFIVIISLVAIRFGKLSKFDIFDRARSTATSEQKITIACESNNNIPASIGDVSELSKYNCRHINLEEIDYYKSQGKIIAEIFRKDPNVKTRSEIYRESWKIIKKSPILGVGYGTITEKLGQDQRGAGLNESNIFLQIWAGSGIFGLIAFVAAFGYLFIFSFRRVSPICPLRRCFSEANPMNRFFGCPVIKDDFEKTLRVFAVLGIAALVIPNLFNAGLFMGIFWLGLAIFVSSKDV